MSDPRPTVSLNKIARELGRSVNPLIEFLIKKGIEIDISKGANAKVTPEAHDLLMNEFSSDKLLKDQAEKRNEDKFVKSEIITAPEKKVVETIEKEEDNIDEILQNTKKQILEEEELKAKKKKAEQKKVVPEPVQEPILIEALEPVKEAVKEPVKEAVKEVVKEPLKEVVKEIEIVKAVEEEAPLLKNRLKGTKLIDTIELPDEGKKPKARKTKVDIEAEKDAAEKEKKKVTKAKEEIKIKEVPKTPAPKIQVIPLTDSDKKKSKAPLNISEALKGNVVEKREEGELTETKYVKLEGPKILNKIEIPVDKEKVRLTPAEKKEKRKRLNKSNYIGGSDTKVFKSPNTTGGADNKGPGTGTPNKPGTGFQGNRGGVGPNRTGGGNYRRPANEFTNKEVGDKLKQTLNRMGNTGAGASGSDRRKFSKQKRDIHAERSEQSRVLQEQEAKVLKVTEFVSANDLAKMMDVPVTEVISACMSLGMMVSINQRLDAEMITIVAEEFDYKVEFVGAESEEIVDEEENIVEDPALLIERPPIVTIMGHVDHGKTSLLDQIRNTNVVAGEAGGITQHLGAYEVTLANGKNIAFIDTPGHEAFTAMRARGAKVTDIVIIVIAADDAIMPQTKEAISHSQAANVPIIFAFNKMDKEGANPDRIREQLSAMNILVEEWGGKIQTQEISAKKGLNIDLLLDKVLIEAEMLQLKANPNKLAVGTVLEATMEKGRGIVASMMVQEGTLRRGDMLLAGQYATKVRALFNERGMVIEKAGPSTPVKILGFAGAPQSGEKFKVYSDEDLAKDIATRRQQLMREQGIRTQKHITLDEIGRRLAIGNFKELKLIVKADVDGSVQALTDSFQKLSTNEVQITILHHGVGQISEGDVMLASASDAIIIGFQVRPSAQARKLGEAEGIDIKYYAIIYDAINDIKAAMEGMLAPTTEEKIICNVEIREVFNITKVGNIAGCMVLDGKIERKTKIRIVRDGVVIHTGELASLKRFKDDVKEVAAGYECGLNINGFNNIQVGDIIEGYEITEVKRKLA
jgi:translation initiation factor IF-2